MDEQKRQFDIMEIWGKMMEKQTEVMTRQIEIQEKQSQENDKVAKNNKFLVWIVDITTVFGVIATIMQAVIAYLEYKKATMVNPPIAIEQSQKFANGRQKTNRKFCEFASTAELKKLQ